MMGVKDRAVLSELQSGSCCFKKVIILVEGRMKENVLGVS